MAIVKNLIELTLNRSMVELASLKPLVINFSFTFLISFSLYSPVRFPGDLCAFSHHFRLTPGTP